MAPKRAPPPEEPPAASSTSEEEETDEGESSEEEESEGEESPVGKKAPAPAKKQDSGPSAKNLPARSPSSGSGSDTESGSESDSPPADHHIRPIASKPMEDTSKVKKARSKASAHTPASPPPKPNASVKRPVESDRDAKDLKKSRKKGSESVTGEAAKEDPAKGSEDPKKQLFQRLWSEDDEITILKGMIDYRKKGGDPLADMEAFSDFIKDSLHTDFKTTQLSDKIRRLKKKYLNNASKSKTGGDRTFSKPHEQNAYDLSRKIWGGGVEASESVENEQSQANGKAVTNQKVTKPPPTPKNELPLVQDDAKKVGADETEHDWPLSRCLNESIQFGKRIGGLGMDEDIIKEGYGLIEEDKRVKIEEEWRKLNLSEFEVHMKRVGLIYEQSKLIWKALNSKKQ